MLSQRITKCDKN